MISVREVLEEEVAFLLVDIERNSAHLSCLQSRDEGAGIDEGTPAGVDEEKSRPRPGDGLGIDEMMGFRIQPAMERHDVGL